MVVAMIKSPSTGTYRIEPESSSIRFTTRHMFGLGKVTGTFAITGGSVSVADVVEDSSVSAVASAASFSTGNQRRDDQVKSPALLHAEQFPEIQFRSTALVNDGTNWTLRGDLTAHGVTSPVDFVVTEVRSDASSLTVHANRTVDRYAHEVTKMKGMAGRHLHLDVTVHATSD